MHFQHVLKHLVRGLVVTPVVMAAVAGGVLVFTAPKTPKPIAAIESAGDPLRAFARQQPPARFMKARDGQTLSYRYYPGKPGAGVAVVVHGSSGTTVAMQGVSAALSARGITVYSIDLRGHGLSKGPDGRLGDVVYRGQYEDDLEDFARLAAREHPGEKRLLLGHSMGGSTILRTAGMARYAKNYDGYLALSPFIAQGTAMDRPDEGGWTSVSVPRIVVLTILDNMHITAFDHLTVLAMAVPDSDRNMRPRAYSHALLASANLPHTWQPAIAAIHAPTRVLIGANDELFHAEAYPAAFAAVNPAIPVTVLKGVGHMGMVYQPEALKAEADTAVEMLK
ncbi:alpha/beta hydrolase [Asticcacaulis solisilvae]|uniref:alpha/beta hydrolase n=1 Tax=Asticcacaulis solisilvae TaxID=1217274 RepID=UPI003FD72070